MKYLSFDGEVFDTEYDCRNYENKIREKREEELKQKEELEMNRLNRLDEINKKYEELEKLVSDYEKDYRVKQRPYFAPFYELMSMLCG